MELGFFEQLKQLGPRFDAEVMACTRELTSGLSRGDDGKTIEYTTLRYGPHERQISDVYWAGREFEQIILFVPGGGFVGGSRTGYREFGEFYARCGYLVFIADYRLAPEAGWPAGAEDVNSFVDCAVAHVGDFGRCGNRPTLIGHSAGATHVAAAVFDNRFNAVVKRTVGRSMLVSGLYIFPFVGMADNVKAYIGPDDSQYFDRSPLNHLDYVDLPISVIASELDPQQFLASALFLKEGLSRIGQSRSHVHMLKGHNHISSILAAGTVHDALSPRLIPFMNA